MLLLLMLMILNNNVSMPCTIRPVLLNRHLHCSVIVIFSCIFLLFLFFFFFFLLFKYFCALCYVYVTRALVKSLLC